MNRQAGFTLLELVIALAIFSLLSLGCWRLYDGLVRVQSQVSLHEQALRRLQRAMGVLERDVLQLVVPVDTPPLVLRQSVLSLQRGNWRNPLDQPRSERQEVSYRFEDGLLWRDSRSPELATIQQQVLLTDVRRLQWRFYDAKAGWRADWPSTAGRPRALEITLSAGRFEQIRRVIPLPEGP
ncbi:type II secretion system protein GspJ [Pseudomonas gingeri]|uniref:Type II secretion system protein J n=1 Tax=Pseudomonas gingeri TaxID=117681 RepID=A0A7Y8CIE6_9PSED|nr:type II secretion system protein GspJ [Pseudomonas gingeri]NWA00388.1 prepilin-type N-terminal cleavage/methylation domain-containing protein [Pseudomonas gingeri]NWA14898.1 prepilin-type N-terminal cleavage/methylation domain-containing protein [Pseudomonas gingeri]NWA58020.1 prepilin-type N-terminal cleavage/methylation domain-containing protein [Pseudomonas gingeri]NWA96882.1 prepilin-type N-terminal cleavage/methylation domain-containing protein [Pseudomonas gingeri]NWB03798.1 prepilin-